MSIELAVPASRADWLEYFNESNFPALTQTVREIITITEDASSSADELRQAIIKDPSLTGQVIKVANSVVFNSAQHPIRTVFQAILQIGFDEIRSIALSVGVIQQISSRVSAHNESLIRLLARSFLAAHLARALLTDKLSEQAVDEAYVAALLSNVGEMAFLSDPIVKHTNYFAILESQDKQVAARQVMHMSFAQLSVALLNAWQVGGLIYAVHLKNAKPSRALVAVRLARQISGQLHHGIDSKGMLRLVESWASIEQISLEQAKSNIVAIAHEAIAKAGAMAMDALAQHIPSGEQDTGKQRPDLSPEQVEHYMLELMQHFSEMAQQKLNINALFEMAAKGIYDASGVERVAMIILNPKTRQPESRYVYGQETSGWKLDFQHLGDPRDNQRIITWVQALKAPVWLKDDEHLSGMRIGAFAAILPDGDCFIAPLILAQRLIGFIYADAQGEHLSEPVFLRFKLIASQVSMTITSAATHS